ncbi:MAG: phenylacetate--CoA ligase, partial [Patescibacteria group bacterium]|nr:phenylacetate--CoA ligase [Patescibacteria group bacterium]
SEYLDREALTKLQISRLQKVAQKVYENVPFYSEMFDKIRLKPSDITSLDILSSLPLTDKETLRLHYPFGMFAVPMAEVKEIHASSGTTGKPTVVAYTENDIKVWSEVMARSIACAGGTKNDIIQNAYGYGLFTGGIGVHYGALELGAAVVPMSSGGTRRQLQIMQDFGTTILTCTPSYSLYLAEEAKATGMDPTRSTLRIGILGAEPWSSGMRREIEKIWNMKAYDIYGLSEIIGPGVAIECEGQEGLHIWADHFLPEVLDPATGKPVPEGEDGMLVLTTLTKEATPFIRYATKDIVNITSKPCPACGRTSPRISRIKGRTDDMLIIRGINVFPSQIEGVLLGIEGIEPHYQIVVSREGTLDEIEVQVEVNERFFADEIRMLEALGSKIRREIEAVLGLATKVKLVEPKTIQRSESKAKRVIDTRKL